MVCSLQSSRSHDKMHGNGVATWEASVEHERKITMTTKEASVVIQSSTSQSECRAALGLNRRPWARIWGGGSVGVKQEAMGPGSGGGGGQCWG